MSDASSSPREFAIALSFPGEHRTYVLQVAEALLPAFGGESGKGRIFYDAWHEDKVIGYNSDQKLQAIYSERADLIVPFYCQDYEKKKWCGVELRAINALLFERQFERVLPFRFDSVKIPGSFDTDVFPIVTERPAKEIARLIIERHHEIRQTASGLPKPTNDPQIRGLSHQQALLKSHVSNLIIPRSEAELKLTERMESGRSLLTSTVKLKDDVIHTTGFGSSKRPEDQQRYKDLWSNYLIWTKFNDQLLRCIFDSAAIALEYSAAREPEATWGVFLAEIEEVEQIINDDIQRLRSIKERLVLFAETSVGTTLTNETFAAPCSIQAGAPFTDTATKEDNRCSLSIKPAVELKSNVPSAPAGPKNAIESFSWIGVFVLGAIFVCLGLAWWWNDTYQKNSVTHSIPAVSQVGATATNPDARNAAPAANPSDRPPSQPTPIIPETAEPRKVKIYIIETNNQEHRYIEKDNDGKSTSNAAWLVNQLRTDSELKTLTEVYSSVVGDDYTGVEHIVNDKPDWILIHRSAFALYPPTKGAQEKPDLQKGDKRNLWDARLVQFISKFSGLQTDFFIYSRVAETNAAWAKQQRQQAGVKGTVSAHQLPQGNPFENPTAVNTLMTELKIGLGEVKKRLGIPPINAQSKTNQ